MSREWARCGDGLARTGRITLNTPVLKKESKQSREEAHEISGVAKVTLWLGCLLINTWARTFRMRADATTREALGRRNPGVHLLWHNRLFTTPEMARRFMNYPGRRIHALISGSKDGAWLSGVFQNDYIFPIRGSSSWRGTEALREIVRVLRQGYDVGITPDGPRGPCYSVQRGALVAARSTGKPITLIAMNPTRFWRLKSWDRFYLPVPFSRVEVRAVGFESYEALEQAAGEEDPADYIRRRLLELSGLPEDASE